MGCLAMWALWVLTGMTAGYPVAKDDVSSGGSHLGTSVLRCRWPIVTVTCAALAPTHEWRHGEDKGWRHGAEDNWSNLVQLGIQSVGILYYSFH